MEENPQGEEEEHITSPSITTVAWRKRVKQDTFETRLLNVLCEQNTSARSDNGTDLLNFFILLPRVQQLKSKY